MIFDTPQLASKQVQVGDKALTLYELSADLYYTHILTPDVIEDAHKASGEMPTAEDTPDYEAIWSARQRNKTVQATWLACALKPGYADASVEALRDNLLQSLSGKQLVALYNEALSVGVDDTAKKSGSPDGASFIG